MTQLRLAAHVVIGVLLGLVFRNFGDEGSKTFSNIACLFFFLLFLFFANAMPAVQMCELLPIRKLYHFIVNSGEKFRSDIFSVIHNTTL